MRSRSVFPFSCSKSQRNIICDSRGVGGGGHSDTEGAAPAIGIMPKKGSFLRPPHVRDFVKEGYFFVPRYEVWGVKIPLQSTKYTRL